MEILVSSYGAVAWPAVDGRDCREFAALVVGIPGAGKSCMLNAAVQEPLFDSGVSYGGGRTVQYERRHFVGRVSGAIVGSHDVSVHLYDTPGLSDAVQRQMAAHHIGDALQSIKSSRLEFTLTFFITFEAGRVRPEDVDTIVRIRHAMLTETQPLLFSIVVNKVPPQALRELHNPSRKNPEVTNRQTFERSVLDVLRLPTDCEKLAVQFVYLEFQPELEQRDNVVCTDVHIYSAMWALLEGRPIQAVDKLDVRALLGLGASGGRRLNRLLDLGPVMGGALESVAGFQDMHRREAQRQLEEHLRAQSARERARLEEEHRNSMKRIQDDIDRANRKHNNSWCSIL